MTPLPSTDSMRYLVFIYLDYYSCCEMRHLSEKILKIIYIYILVEKIKQVYLIECSFHLGTDKESSDKEVQEIEMTSTESESEESDHDSDEEEAQTQSDTEADVGLKSLLEDPSAEKQSDSKVSFCILII